MHQCTAIGESQKGMQVEKFHIHQNIIFVKDRQLITHVFNILHVSQELGEVNLNKAEHYYKCDTIQQGYLTSEWPVSATPPGTKPQGLNASQATCCAM